tara:strand:+ start:380 stop:1687 length:1308 start_codon:yes stop_codon:yes gene_type:complete
LIKQENISKLKIAFLAFTAFLYSFSISYSNEFSDFDLQRLSYVDSLTNKLIKEKKITGASIQIQTKNNIIYDKKIGFGDVNKKVILNDSTIFRIYSMTKPITSVAAMILLERGLIKLDDPISQYLPEFSEMKKIKVINIPFFKHLFHFTRKVDKEITIFHLLTHTSGMYYDFSSRYGSVYKKFIKGSEKKINSLDDFSKQASKLPLLFEPGFDFNYGISTDILGRIVEVVSGKDLASFLKDEIFTPLEMNSTSFNFDNDIKDLLTVYENLNDKIVPYSILNISPIANYPLGGAGLFSTLSDYSNFCTMLQNRGSFKNKRIISKNSIELMTKNHLKNLNGENAKRISRRLPIVLIEGHYETTFPMDGFGLGFYINESLSDQKTIASKNRYGWMGAANTFFFIDKENDFFTIIMSQSKMDFSILNDYENVIYQAIKN